jgi:hypothetical protein
MREYWDRTIHDEKHFRATVDYIHANPVKAGLVHSAEEWPWSSASEYAAAGLSPGRAEPQLGMLCPGIAEPQLGRNAEAAVLNTGTPPRIGERIEPPCSDPKETPTAAEPGLGGPRRAFPPTRRVLKKRFREAFCRYRRERAEPTLGDPREKQQ